MKTGTLSGLQPTIQLKEQPQKGLLESINSKISDRSYIARALPLIAAAASSVFLPTFFISTGIYCFDAAFSHDISSFSVVEKVGDLAYLSAVFSLSAPLGSLVIEGSCKLFDVCKTTSQGLFNRTFIGVLLPALTLGEVGVQAFKKNMV